MICPGVVKFSFFKSARLSHSLLLDSNGIGIKAHCAINHSSTKTHVLHHAFFRALRLVAFESEELCALHNANYCCCCCCPIDLALPSFTCHSLAPLLREIEKLFHG